MGLVETREELEEESVIVLARDEQFSGGGAEEGGVLRLCEILCCMWKGVGWRTCLLDVGW